MESQPRIRIAICGGGIGGISLAVVLGKHCSDVSIDLYEAQPDFTEIGAGISIWKRTWCVIQMLGLDTLVGKIAVKPPADDLEPATCYRKSDQETEGFTFNRMVVPHGSITVHRADMLKVLTDNLPPSTMFHPHFNKRLISYTTKNESVILHFADGTPAEADMLVGADGIKSATRVTMYKSLSEKTGDERLKGFLNATWSGTYAYRTLIETDKLLKEVPGHRAAMLPMMYCGKSKHVVSYPISQGQLVNIVAFVSFPESEGTELDGPAVIDVPKEEMLLQYQGWEPEVSQLLNCADKVSRWAMCHIRNLPTYVDGLVAILGDAAHAMTPHCGQGAGSAMEDALILGKLLASPHVNSSNLESVLKIYDTIRVPYGNLFVECSRTCGRIYEFNDLPDYIDERSICAGSIKELRKLAREIYRMWGIKWSDLPDAEWKEAEEMLMELVRASGPKTEILNGRIESMHI